MNDGTLNNRFAIYSTPGNAVIYTDYVRANAAATITKDQGGLMAISTDEMTRTKRTLYFDNAKNQETGMTHKQSDGSQFLTMNTNWVNIDNALGVINVDGKTMGFGNRANNNSVNTSKLYASYSDKSKDVKAGDIVDKRNIIYYSNVNAESTRKLMQKTISLKEMVAEGWNGVIATDPDGASYMLLSNFCGEPRCQLKNVQLNGAAPVFTVETNIVDSKADATFLLDTNHSKGEILGFTVKGSGLQAIQDAEDSTKVYLKNLQTSKNKVTLNYQAKNAEKSITLTLKTNQVIAVYYDDKTGELVVEDNVDYPASYFSSSEQFQKCFSAAATPSSSLDKVT